MEREQEHRSPTEPTGPAGRWRRPGLVAALSLGIVAWEYLLNAVMNPDVDWNPTGVAAHLALDLALLLPLAAVALLGGRRLARRLGLQTGDAAGRLGTVGTVCLVFLVAAVPLTSTRDLAHEWMGQTYGLSLAEVLTTVVTTDLTVQEATQLCSFGSVRNPSLARDTYQDLETTVLNRAASGFSDALIQLAALLPLLLLGSLRSRGASRRPRTGHSAVPAGQLLRVWGHPLRVGGLAAAAVLLLCVGYGLTGSGVSQAYSVIEEDALDNACTDGGPVREYDVAAIDVTLTLNRWGDHVDGAHMYALDARIPAIRDFEAALDRDRAVADDFGNTPARVSPGLRQDPIQPLVIRANLGECLRVNFTNRLTDGQPSSMHILGLPHTVTSAASAVGRNPDTFARPGETVTYEIPIPDDPDAERAYYFHDHGAGRRRQNMGLFGAIVAEPKGATYLDVETGEPLDTTTGSNWEAIILDPNLDARPDGKSFREFVIFYHEIGDEAFTDIRDRDDKKLPLVDDIAGVYRPAARALNYRSEPFRHRIEQDKAVNGPLAGAGKSQGYNSYSFGDPATPIPRSYVGEGVKTRLLHGGSEVFHVHHLHGGGDRWRRNPNADPKNDFWKGLTKVPDPDLTSIHLDSQSIGPGTSYNLEHECGAGGCQQGVGEFLYHCHIGHHYISGMWSFWRVFGTLQTAVTNVNGHPLAKIPDLFQTESPLQPTTEPEHGVSAGELLGLVVDGGKVISERPTTASTVNLREWIERMLPPRGTRLDALDSTVWDWTMTGSGADLRVWGEPESENPFPGWVSTTPGERPEVLFNPKNGRYTWPLFRPHNAQRPPFTARHSGAPWLGEKTKEGRLDGLCATPDVIPEVGPTVTQRYYPLSAISLPLQVTADTGDPDGMLFVLNEEEEAIRSGRKAAEPLAIRSNVGDCVELVLTNKIPDGPLNKGFSKVNLHSHFVQFDTQASDGVMTGFSYEQSVLPYQEEGRWLTGPAGAGSTTLSVNHTDRLRAGIWLGVGLGEGTCGTTADGQPEACTEVRQIVGLTEDSITLDEPLANDHATSEAVGVEFVRYHWFSDVDVGTVFYHTHVEFKDWDHGLFGSHIVEPKGSTYHDPVTGEEVRSGTLVDIRIDPAAGGNPVAHDVRGSFREFMLFLQNNNPVEGRFSRGGGTINLRAEPWRLRQGDAAYRFSSVTHGDPWTQEIRAYVGDPVVIRGLGLVERVGGIRVTGHRFNLERTSADSDVRDAMFIGISERFDVSLDGGAGGPGGHPGDYLYYSTLGRDFESGAWGLLRVHDTAQGDLQPLPDRAAPSGGDGFPELSFTGQEPPSLAGGAGRVCPRSATQRRYRIEIRDSAIVYNEQSAPDRRGVVYNLQGLGGDQARTPLVLRANAGDCLVLDLENLRRRRSSISVGELDFDPQRSYGSAVGFNYDSTVAPGETRRYRYYADRELGIVHALNLGDVDSISRGAFASIVIEPAGSHYFRPGRNEPLPGGGAGVQADIETQGLVTRELVALFNDQDRRIGQNAMPYPEAIERSNGIDYSAEPLDLRDRTGDPAGVFKSTTWGDPRHVVTVPAGTPLVYRIGQPWGEQVHVPTLEGHRWLLEPGMAGSEQVFNDVLAPGMSLDAYFVGGAGGDIRAPGDYLFLDRRQPFLEGGLWNLLRVTGDGTSGADDRVTIFYVATESVRASTLLKVRGSNSLRPAGDFAGSVTVSDCAGSVLGSTAVDPGSGAWQLETTVAAAPAEVCVESSGGGSATKELAL